MHPSCSVRASRIARPDWGCPAVPSGGPSATGTDLVRGPFLTQNGWMNARRAIVILLIVIAVLIVLGVVFGLDGSGGGGGGTGGTGGY